MSKRSWPCTLTGLAVIGLAVIGLSIVGCRKETPEERAEAPAAVTYANTVCPMMGSVIKPEKVTPKLVREFQGQKVAFCCAQCPPAWDKLSDAEKLTKLQAAKKP